MGASRSGVRSGWGASTSGAGVGAQVSTPFSWDELDTIDPEAIDAEDLIPEPPERHVTVFSTLDMKSDLAKPEYRNRLAAQQRRRPKRTKTWNVIYN